jgi:hypothetical protein
MRHPTSVLYLDSWEALFPAVPELQLELEQGDT